MPEPISMAIAGLVLAVIGVIQGGRKIFTRLWDRLKVAFGGLRSQRSYTHTIIPLRENLQLLTHVSQAP